MPSATAKRTLFYLPPPVSLCNAQATNRIELPEANISFTTPEQFSVGNASDVLVELLCVGDGPTIRVFWVRRGSGELPNEFSLTSTFYNADTGRLRLFSPYIQNPQHRDEEGLINLQCFRNFGNSIIVALRPGGNCLYAC